MIRQGYSESIVKKTMWGNLDTLMLLDLPSLGRQ